jgi:excisionase family DNA binding protein
MSKIIVTTESELELLIQNAVRKVLNSLPSQEQTNSAIYLNLKEAAVFLNLSPQTLYQFTSSRTIPFFKRGKKLYFSKESLKIWLDEGKKKSRQEILNDLDRKEGFNE